MVAGDGDQLAILVNSLRRHLQRQQRWGVRFVARPELGTITPMAIDTKKPLDNAPQRLSGQPGKEKVSSLEELRGEIGECRRCKLHLGRTHVVFGVGNPTAKLMFVGEGPGADEDLKGEPFVGRAGQLLTDIITKGMGLAREDVYIANVVKCRPPQNRNPEPDEVATCEPFLKKQIELIHPKIIIALGKFAVQTLLQSKVPITRLRGNWHTYLGIKLMPTFHPAYLLRNPADKKLVWEDIKKVIVEMQSENA